MPPPVRLAELPEMVQAVTVALPVLAMPPPPTRGNTALVAVFPVTVVSEQIMAPSLVMAPPVPAWFPVKVQA